MPLIVPNKESNDMESYRKLEEVRRYSNKELKVSRELIETVRGQKDFATLGKLKSFQYVSGIPGMAYNPFVNEEAREAYFDYEQVIVLNFWVERIKETGMLMVEQPKLGIFFRRTSGRTLGSRAEGASDFSLWFLGRSLESQPSNHVGAHEAFLVSAS